MIATQFFYTLCFIAALIGFGLVMFFFLCAGPDQKFFVKLIKVSLYNAADKIHRILITNEIGKDI